MKRSRGARAAIGLLPAVVTACVLLLPGTAQAQSLAVPNDGGIGERIEGTIGGGFPRAVPFAGLYPVEVNGAPTWAYCIDILSPLQRHAPHEEGTWSASSVPNLGNVARILARHPADLTAQNGDTAEAAAVQAAIWHFTDALALTSASPRVLALYGQIVADAQANPVSEPSTSLQLAPADRTGVPGDVLPFTLDTTSTQPVELMVHPADGADLVACDAGGAPLGSSVGGPFPRQVCLRRSTAGGPVTLTASALATAPAGRVFLRQGSQKIILAASRGIGATASVTASWSVPAPAPTPPVEVPAPVPSAPEASPTPAPAPAPVAPAPAPVPAPAPAPVETERRSAPAPRQEVRGVRRTKVQRAKKARKAKVKRGAVRGAPRRARPRAQIPYTP